MKRAFKQILDKYIRDLKIPAYNEMRHYNYYDVLEALVRNLLQNIITEKKMNLELKDLEKDDSSLEDAKEGEEGEEGKDVFKGSDDKKEPNDDESQDAEE